MNNKGFTLVEVLAVVAIITILGLVATPSVLSMINTSKNSSYDIMVDNIRIAAEEAYEEIEYFDSKIYYYSVLGKENTLVLLDDNKIIVDLQTLVGNGFLSGKNNDEYEGENKNKKIIINPKTNNDIGICEIEVTKKVNDSTGKVCYIINGYDGEDEYKKANCPTSDDFGGDNQCAT